MDRNGAKVIEPNTLIFTGAKDYFSEVLDEALKQRRMVTYPIVKSYIIDVLFKHMFSDHLFQEDESGKRRTPTRAELFLGSSYLDPAKKVEMLKRLGDSSLYIAGFFSQSLQRKITDVEYYVDMGALAYRHLAAVVNEKSFVQVFEDMALRFSEYTEVLSCIQLKTMPNQDVQLLSLFDRYTKLNSEVAKEQLEKLGVIAIPGDQISRKKQ